MHFSGMLLRKTDALVNLFTCFLGLSFIAPYLLSFQNLSQVGNHMVTHVPANRHESVLLPTDGLHDNPAVHNTRA